MEGIDDASMVTHKKKEREKQESLSCEHKPLTSSRFHLCDPEPWTDARELMRIHCTHTMKHSEPHCVNRSEMYNEKICSKSAASWRIAPGEWASGWSDYPVWYACPALRLGELVLHWRLNRHIVPSRGNIRHKKLYINNSTKRQHVLAPLWEISKNQCIVTCKSRREGLCSWEWN